MAPQGRDLEPQLGVRVRQLLLGELGGRNVERMGVLKVREGPDVGCSNARPGIIIVHLGGWFLLIPDAAVDYRRGEL